MATHEPEVENSQVEAQVARFKTCVICAVNKPATLFVQDMSSFPEDVRGIHLCQECLTSVGAPDCLNCFGQCPAASLDERLREAVSKLQGTPTR